MWAEAINAGSVGGNQWAAPSAQRSQTGKDSALWPCWGYRAPSLGPGDYPLGGRWEDFTSKPVEGALALDGAEALAPGDGRVIPQEAAGCCRVQLTICQKNISHGNGPWAQPLPAQGSQ